MKEQLYKMLANLAAFNNLYMKLAQQNGISLAELYVYMAFEEHAYQITNGQIVEYTGYSKQTISSLIKRYEKKGLIISQESSQDKRSKILVPTNEGKQQLERVLTSVHASELQALNELGLKKTKVLNDVSTELIAILGKQVEK